MDFTIYLQFFISLIALVNPLGVIPIFYGMTSDYTKEEQKEMVLITCFSLTMILLVSFFFGNFILHSFSISIGSFRIAGGIVVAMIANTMINGKIGENKINKEEKKIDPESYHNLAIVPLAIPLMGGPGSISASIVFGTNQHSILSYLLSSLTIALFGLSCYLLLRFSKPLIRMLGKTGSNVVTRIMGLILMALGIEIIVTGLRDVGFLPLMS